MIFTCPWCSSIKESEGTIVICSRCGITMKVEPFKPCTQVEIKNPYPTDIHGQVVAKEDNK